LFNAVADDAAEYEDPEVTRMLPLNQPNHLVRWVTRHWIWFLIAAIILIIAPILTPGAVYFWSYWGFESLFRDDLGFGANVSAVLALVFAFCYAMAAPLALRWLIIGRRRLESFIAILIVFGSTPALHMLLDSNFNQATGAAQKWYVWRPGGDIILSDAGGFDPLTGTEKRRLTPDIARLIERQKRGLRPGQITSDPRQLEFFDRLTGMPKIWYSTQSDGAFRLFDSEGFDPSSGVLLTPITDNLISKIYAHAAEAALQTQAAAALRAEQEAATAKAKAHNDLMSAFSPGVYPPGTVLVGVRARQLNDPTSRQAAQVVVYQAVAALRARGIHAAEVASGVYGAKFFDKLMQGDTTPLSETGLMDKMGAALLIWVDCTCQPVTSINGLVSCNIITSNRIISAGNGEILANEWKGTGVGVNRDAAIAQGAEFLFERHQIVLPEKQ
jgi:hypothetical protein